MDSPAWQQREAVIDGKNGITETLNDSTFAHPPGDSHRCPDCLTRAIQDYCRGCWQWFCRPCLGHEQVTCPTCYLKHVNQSATHGGYTDAAYLRDAPMEDIRANLTDDAQANSTSDEHITNVLDTVPTYDESYNLASDVRNYSISDGQAASTGDQRTATVDVPAAVPIRDVKTNVASDVHSGDNTAAGERSDDHGCASVGRHAQGPHSSVGCHDTAAEASLDEAGASDKNRQGKPSRSAGCGGMRKPDSAEPDACANAGEALRGDDASINPSNPPACTAGEPASSANDPRHLTERTDESGDNTAAVERSDDDGSASVGRHAQGLLPAVGRLDTAAGASLDDAGDSDYGRRERSSRGAGCGGASTPKHAGDDESVRGSQSLGDDRAVTVPTTGVRRGITHGDEHIITMDIPVTAPIDSASIIPYGDERTIATDSSITAPIDHARVTSTGDDLTITMDYEPVAHVGDVHINTSGLPATAPISGELATPINDARLTPNCDAHAAPNGDVG